MNENGASPINDFEQQVWLGSNETALDSLLRLLAALSTNGGRSPNIPQKEFHPDFILKRLGVEPTSDFLMTAQPDELFKLSILYGAESSLPINFSAFFKRAPKLATSLAIAILSNRLLATQSAHQKRELLLRWITEALGKLDNIAALPVEILVDLSIHI